MWYSCCYWAKVIGKQPLASIAFIEWEWIHICTIMINDLSSGNGQGAAAAVAVRLFQGTQKAEGRRKPFSPKPFRCCFALLFGQKRCTSTGSFILKRDTGL